MIQLHNQKDGFKETWELGLYWKSQPVLRIFKKGIEIRVWSVGQDNSQFWVRISCGTIKYVVDSIQDNTEIPADPQEDQVQQTNIKNPQQREPVDRTAAIPIQMDRHWAIKTNSRCEWPLEESDQFSSTQSNSTLRKRWSNSILQNYISFSKLFLTNTALTW